MTHPSIVDGRLLGYNHHGVMFAFTDDSHNVHMNRQVDFGHSLRFVKSEHSTTGGTKFDIDSTFVYPLPANG